MKANIKKLYLANFLTGLVFWYAIEKVFQQSIGLDSFGIAICVAAYLITSIVFDIPSGLLADRWNRKYTLMLSSVMMALSSLILGSADGLALYMLGLVAYGLYEVLASGTYQAITYDTLHELDRKKEFSKVFGRMSATFLLGTAVGSIIGGYMAQAFSLRKTFYITILSALLNVLVMATLKEPTLHRKISDKKILRHASDAAKTMIKTPILVQAGLLLFVTWIVANVQYEFNHLYLIGIGFGTLALGFINAGLGLSEALGSLMSHRTSKKFFAVFTVMIAIISIGFPLTRNYIFGPILLFILLTVRAVVENQAETLIQDSVESDIRATSVSIVGFVSNIVSVPVVLIFGLVARWHNINTAFLVFGTLIAAIIFGLYIHAQRKSESIFTTDAE